MDDDEINMNLNNCKLSSRWITLQGININLFLNIINFNTVKLLGLHNQIDNLYRIKFPETSDKFMIFATIPRHVVLPEFVISQVSQFEN